MASGTSAVGFVTPTAVGTIRFSSRDPVYPSSGTRSRNQATLAARVSTETRA
jgi:hypothetical protein